MRSWSRTVEPLACVGVGVLLGLLTGCPAETTLGFDSGALDGGSAADTATDGTAIDAPRCAIPDRDGDGSRAMECGGTDCDDDDPDRHPGAIEVCDVTGVDEDCDPTTFGFRDGDADGVADARCCNHIGGDHCGSDCDDAAPGVHPSAPEVCNMHDDDCDAATDEGVSVMCWADADMDGFATATALPMTLCSCTSGTTATQPIGTSIDCDDTRIAVNPAVPEVCGNGRDDDCDGMIDGSGSAWFADCDADGFADPGSTPVTACTEPGTRPTCTEPTPRWSTDARDCNDHDASIRPGAIERCNGIDDDCSTATADGATDASCAPGTGACIDGACCTGCVLGGTCQDGTMASSCGGGGGACTVCGECIACSARVCTGPANDGACGSGSGLGTCVAGSCCTGCVESGACMPGTAAGACGYEGNLCSTCPACAASVCTGGDSCTDYLDISALGRSTYAVDTCALTDSFTASCTPAGTRDAVLSGVEGGYNLSIADEGWALVYLTDDGACNEDPFGCRTGGFAGVSGVSPVTHRFYFGVERLDGGCGRVTVTVDH